MTASSDPHSGAPITLSDVRAAGDPEHLAMRRQCQRQPGDGQGQPQPLLVSPQRLLGRRIEQRNPGADAGQAVPELAFGQRRMQQDGEVPVRIGQQQLAAALDIQAIPTIMAFREGILAGNSIHTDRRFLARYMPLLEGFLHYRQLDVSSLKILASAWYPGLPRFEKGEKTHTALADVRGSLGELAYYREKLFRSG